METINTIIVSRVSTVKWYFCVEGKRAVVRGARVEENPPWLLTSFPAYIILSPFHPSRGAVMRRRGSGGGMRCPRAWGIRIPGARAAPGFRPGALGPPARSSLTVRATCRKADQPPKARPGRRQDTAMERRGAQVSPIARRNLAPTRCDPLWAPRGAPFPHRAMREKGRGNPAHPAPVKQYGR